MEEMFAEYVARALHDSGTQEVAESAAMEKARTSVEPFIEKLGAQVAIHALQNMASIRANRRVDRGFMKRLQRRYGRAFMAYTIMMACAHEAGEALASKGSSGLSEERAASFEVLIRLHAKACRVSGEVSALLINGYPEGALARCRTLHEMAVIAGAIGDCIDDAQNGDLALRYLEHEVIAVHQSARQHQKDHQALGVEPLGQDYLDELEALYDAALAKYGTEFKREYGWAKKYCPDANFRALEAKVRMGHMRAYYQLASNEVHSGSRGLSLNFTDFRGQVAMRVGKTNVGLTEPASMALNSLYQVTVVLLIKGLPDCADLTGLITMKALDELREQAAKFFYDATLEIRSDEARIYQRSGS
ncbi:DUF5677 domain-containing protein [Streptomyces sp. FIT100]|uniref:DUF5677 domain-containing protein n=1 Tax=Streptomyces sp. FIT100 TaxID=2837956 RepID=UPI0021C59E73|nr:DUF5677 domain-containing protein [Streptomyces sp. FIT100]UUN27797.1 hypothetical protein KK483_16380 [Streptomyces sp. FIT100]